MGYFKEEQIEEAEFQLSLPGTPVGETGNLIFIKDYQREEFQKDLYTLSLFELSLVNELLA